MSPTSSAPKPLVVLVEDDPSTCQVFAMALELEGFLVIPFETAEAALERMDVLRPAALVTDLSLRGIGGAELVRQLRAIPGLESVAYFAWTGWDPKQLATSDTELFRAIFRKPTDVGTVGAAIRDAVLGSAQTAG